jgi:hypothetical protein
MDPQGLQVQVYNHNFVLSWPASKVYLSLLGLQSLPVDCEANTEFGTSGWEDHLALLTSKPSRKEQDKQKRGSRSVREV